MMTTIITFPEAAVISVVLLLLGGIASTNIEHYRERARQAEAKVGLAGIYMAEKAALAERGSYSLCLAAIGYAPDPGKYFYALGFGPNLRNSMACGLSDRSCLRYTRENVCRR